MGSSVPRNSVRLSFREEQERGGGKDALSH